MAWIQRFGSETRSKGMSNQDEDEQTLVDVQIDDFIKQAKCFG